jgi:hypothetical protein
MVLRPLRTRGVNFSGVETLPLLTIAEQIVSAGGFLEFLFRCLVTGIEIRMQCLRQLSVCLLDVG